MKQFIVIAGVSGVGKTTLAQVLARQYGLRAVLEQHAERPFQILFERDKKFALANQIDYLLYRAEQERALRQDGKPFVVDGGLDVDFHVFTRLFYEHGWLSAAEFDLCRRFYEHTRSLLPPPDLIIHLTAPQEIVRARLASRQRINIASAEDAALQETFTQDWLSALPPERVLRADVSNETQTYAALLTRIQNWL
ncbi:MAG: deoxynucleoside kinase [Anaerolineales bacterium]